MRIKAGYLVGCRIVERSVIIWCVIVSRHFIVIFLLLSSPHPLCPLTPGVEDIVAIMIPEPKGKEIVSLLERNITVTMYITIGTRNLQKYVSRTSVVFVSISFIVLMIISLAWLVFYYIQRFRYANARDRNQVSCKKLRKNYINYCKLKTYDAVNFGNLRRYQDKNQITDDAPTQDKH